MDNKLLLQSKHRKLRRQLFYKDICNKCLLGEWLIEEPYASIGHVRFCEGLLRLESLIAKEYR